MKINIFAPLFIVFAAFLWAVDGIALRPVLYSLPVSLVVFIEHGLAFLVMLPFLVVEFKELKKLKTSDWSAFLWVAIFGGVLGTMFITKALFYVQFVNLSVVVLIQKLQPIFAIFLAGIILKEKMPKRFFLWSAIAILATYFVTFSDFLPNLDTGDKTAIAALFALGAAFSWGSSTVFSKKALSEVNFRVGTYLRFGLTTLIMLLIVTTTGSLLQVTQITNQQWLIFWLIVFTTGGLAIFFYYYGLKRVRASISGIAELAFPLSAILLEFLIRGRVLSWSQWIGAIILFIANYKVSLRDRQP